MSSNDEAPEDASPNGGESMEHVKQRFKSKKVAKTKEMLSKRAIHTKQMLSKQAVKLAKQAEEHESFISKVTHLLGVLGFGGFCFLLGARPQDIAYVYRELSKKAQIGKQYMVALSGLLGDQNRMWLYIGFEAIFTVATMALTSQFLSSCHIDYP